MPLSIEIIPTTDVVHMFGSHEAGLSAGYSISGQVVVSVTPSRSLAAGQQRHPALLSALTLTFEGKQEHFARGQGYTARRLCQSSQKLVIPTKPLAIPSTPGHKVAIVFDVALPGWLPSTLTSSHSTTATTSYGLFATATYSSDEFAGVFSLSKTRHLQAQPVPIIIKRNRTTSAPKPCCYALSPFAKSETSKLPPAIIKAVCARIGVPSHVDVENPNFDLKLELGAALPGISVTRFTVKVAQKCTYSTSPDPTCSFPLPAAQPPTVPLLSNHELDALYACGVKFPAELVRLDKCNIVDASRAHTFLMKEGAEGHRLEKTPSNITVGVRVDPTVVLPDYQSPFLEVGHHLQVEFDVCYNGIEEMIMVKMPLAFVESYAPAPSTNLPAYVQLFHSNGDARYVPGLPAYSRDVRPGEIVDTTGAHPVDFQRRHLPLQSLDMPRAVVSY